MIKQLLFLGLCGLPVRQTVFSVGTGISLNTRHIISNYDTIGLTKLLEKDLTISNKLAIELISFGAVYLQRQGDVKARRIMADVPVFKGEYIRCHLRPKLFPLADSIDWKSTIIEETEDFILINKPSGLPSNPTLDNARQNVVTCLQQSLSLENLFLAHRLDVETSGLLILGKTKSFIADICGQFKRRTVSKQYRMLIASDTSDLKFREGDRLCHFMDASSTSPKVFRAEQLDPNSISCESVVANMSSVLTIASMREFPNNEHLAAALLSWSTNAQAPLSFCDVTLDLLTGRTHQCRGQLQQGGWHIAGDNMYRGITSVKSSEHYPMSTFLALQSKAIAFDWKGGRKYFQIDRCWWDDLW